MEKTYVEVKVTFIHIVVLLVAVILIGTFLFYLGYQAGKSSARIQDQTAGINKSPDNIEEIRLNDDKEKKQLSKPVKTEPSIKDEIRLHQLPTTTEKTSEKSEVITEKPLKKEKYYSIQVGAFSDYANAKQYSDKFAKIGYPAEIFTTVKDDQKLFRVRVGQYERREDARKELKKLQQMENRKFTIVNPD